jgi:FHS family glucose/mannose:H+ symporter-like MFS transporter
MHRNHARLTLLVSCTAYIGTGILIASMGPLLSELSGRTGATLAALGGLFMAFYLGSFLAQSMSGPLSERIGLRPVMMDGLAIMAAGAVGLTLARSLTAVLAGGFVAGFGQGAIDIAVNLLVVKAYQHRSVSALNALHLFFGVGSMVGPAVVSLALRLTAGGGNGTGLPAMWLGSLLLMGLMVPVARLATAGRTPGGDASQAETPAGQSDTAGRAFSYRSPFLWVYAGLLLLFVGVEMGTGGWITTYMGRVAAMPVAQAALVTSGYWLALTVGRFLGVVAGGRVTPRTLLGIDLGGTVVAALVMAAGGHSTLLTVAGVLLLGLSYGSIYPNVVAIVTSAFPTGQGRATSVVGSASSVGGVAIPPMQGLFLQYSGPASLPLIVGAGNLAMVVLFLAGRARGDGAAKRRVVVKASSAPAHPE